MQRKRPPRARSSRGVFPNDCLQGFSDAWHAYLAKGSPFSDTWRANLAGKGRFSRPRPLLGCMERKTCRGLPPGNAPWLHLATAAPFKNASRRHLAEKALGCPGLLRNRSGVRESEDVARTKRRPIQQRAPTRPRNHENILVPFAKKRHRKRTRVVWRT